MYEGKWEVGGGWGGVKFDLLSRLSTYSFLLPPIVLVLFIDIEIFIDSR